MVDYAKFIVISTNNVKGKNTKFPCSPRTSNNFLQELDTLCPSHTDLLAPRVCARGRLRVKAVKLLHGRGTLRLCPSHTDLVTLTRLCQSEASVKLPIRGWVVCESSSPHCTNFMKIIYIYIFTAPSKPKAQKEHHCHPKLNTRRIHLEDKIGRRMGLPFPHKYFKPFTCYHFFF